MRIIKHLVVHCSATSQTATVDAIKRYWKEKLGWVNYGYHVIITASGEIVRLAKDEAICNGVAGHNSTSLHVCYIGGIDANGKSKDSRTFAQKSSLYTVLTEWRKKYPNATILGHRDFKGVAKDCPCFDAKKEYENI